MTLREAILHGMRMVGGQKTYDANEIGDMAKSSGYVTRCKGASFYHSAVPQALKALVKAGLVEKIAHKQYRLAAKMVARWV